MKLWLDQQILLTLFKFKLTYKGSSSDIVVSYAKPNAFTGEIV